MVLECSGYDDHVQSNVVTQHNWESKIFTLVGWGRTSHSWIRYYSFINQLVWGPMFHHLNVSSDQNHSKPIPEEKLWAPHGGNHSGFVRNSGNYPKKIHGIPHFQSHPHLRLAASLGPQQNKKCLEGKLLATACASLELKWFRSCPIGPVPCGRWSLGLFQGKSKETYGLWPMAL